MFGCEIFDVVAGSDWDWVTVGRSGSSLGLSELGVGCSLEMVCSLRSGDCCEGSVGEAIVASVIMEGSGTSGVIWSRLRLVLGAAVGGIAGEGFSAVGGSQ